MVKLPASLFSLPLEVAADSVGEKIPRRFSDAFDIKSASLGSSERGFLLASALVRPTLAEVRALIGAVSKVDSRCVVVFSPSLDAGIMDSLAAEGIPYVRDTRNVFLPFMGMASSPVPMGRPALPLSPNAQRIALNLVAGRWDGFSAGDLAEAMGVSRATVSNCLAEVEAVLPPVVFREGKRRVLRNSGFSKEGLLDAFESYLVSPVKSRKLLLGTACLDALRGAGALLSGESALPYFSDLAHGGTLFLALPRKSVSEVMREAGDAWAEARWFEEPDVVVEEWAYALDARDSVSRASSGFDALDPLSLYSEMRAVADDEARLADAVAQLREVACR